MARWIDDLKLTRVGWRLGAMRIHRHAGSETRNGKPRVRVRESFNLRMHRKMKRLELHTRTQGDKQ